MRSRSYGRGPWVGAQTAMVDMEEEFLNLGLDIIGMGVFNYDFGSITRTSPVIQVLSSSKKLGLPGHKVCCAMWLWL